MAFETYGSRKSGDWLGELGAIELEQLLRDLNIRTTRGYTGHEQLDRTGFIHMNGRVYDPVLQRFLSPDPIVQAPTFSQSWNRYTYALNSPLSLVDPSGYATLCSNADNLVVNLDRMYGSLPFCDRYTVGFIFSQYLSGTSYNTLERDIYLVNQTINDIEDSSRREAYANGAKALGRTSGGSGGFSDIAKGIGIGLLDDQARALYYEPVISVANPLISAIPGLDPSMADIFGIAYVSPFGAAANSEEQLGRDLSPAAAIIFSLVARSPRGLVGVPGRVQSRINL